MNVEVQQEQEVKPEHEPLSEKFVKRVNPILMDYTKSCFVATLVAACTGLVVIIMFTISVADCRIVSQYGHPGFHPFYIADSSPICIFGLFERDGTPAGTACKPPAGEDSPEGTIYGLEFCEEHHYKGEDMYSLYMLMESAGYCTSSDNLYLGYYKECLAPTTAIGSALGYLTAALGIFSTLFVLLFSTCGVIKKKEKEPQQ